MIEFLASVPPPVIWSTVSGLIGAVIALIGALGGVALSNVSHSKRLRIQLQHDAAENAKERKAQLRRDVYLVAVEEIAKVTSHLGSLAQVDVTTTNPADALKGFQGATAKLVLVAEPKTALLVSDLASKYS